MLAISQISKQGKTKYQFSKVKTNAITARHFNDQIEVKLSDVTPSKNWAKFLPLIGCKFALQIVNKPYWKKHEYNDTRILIADAAEVFQYFV